MNIDSFNSLCNRNITSGIFSKSELFYMIHVWSLSKTYLFDISQIDYLLNSSHYKLFKDFIHYVYDDSVPSFLQVYKNFPEVCIKNSHFDFIKESFDEDYY